MHQQPSHTATTLLTSTHKLIVVFGPPLGRTVASTYLDNMQAENVSYCCKVDIDTHNTYRSKMLSYMSSSRAFVSKNKDESVNISKKKRKRSGNSTNEVDTCAKRKCHDPNDKTLPIGSKRNKDRNFQWDNFKIAMKIFKKYCPGLGHDGDGLYGTLTNNSLQHIMNEIQPREKILVDIGAADGKVLLAGLSFGAHAAFGMELAGDALETKFEAMINGLKKETNFRFPSNEQMARLKCSTDITTFKSGTTSDMLLSCFPKSFKMVPGKNILVCAVWHGFTISAKESLLRRLANSHFVESFTLVGPQLKDYGKPEEVLAYMKNENPRFSVRKVSSSPVKLSGGGEHYQAVTFYY